MRTDQSDPEIDEDDTLFTINIDNDNRRRITDDGFEFPCVLQNSDTCPVTADEIFSEGKIRPIFSKTDQVTKNVSKPPVKSALTRRSLSHLFTEDSDFFEQRRQPSCLSRSTYCEWAPQKSSSTGTSKRWKFPRILRRCNSDNKDGLAFYGHSEDNVSGQNCDAGKANVMVSGHYPSKKTDKYGNRRKSYLPYKQDLIGLFANISNKPGG